MGSKFKNLNKWSLVRMAQATVSTGKYNGKVKLVQVIMAPAI